MNLNLKSGLTTSAVPALAGILGTIVALILSVAQLLGITTGHSSNTEVKPGQTKIVVSSDAPVFFPQTCLVAEGIATDKAHRFDSKGEYIAVFEPGEHTVKVHCHAWGQAGSGSSYGEYKGETTFTATEDGPEVVTVKVS